MMKVIVSGFEPSWGIKKTPSGEFAKLWKDKVVAIEGADVRGVILPQIYGKCTEILCNEITAFRPHIVLMFGATQHNDPLRLERFAINVERTPMGDNTKIPVIDRPIICGGPSAYESTIPVMQIVEKLNSVGINAKASYYAGTHVCNSLMYGVLHHISKMENVEPIVAGFIHVPFPNEFGVIEDEFWSTSTFPGIINAGTSLIEQTCRQYVKTYCPVWKKKDSSQ